MLTVSGMVAREHVHLLLETFEHPNARIVACEDSERLHEFLQRIHDRRQQSIHRLRQGLDDEVVAVPIDDE